MFKSIRKFLSKAIKKLAKVLAFVALVLDFMKHLDVFVSARA